MNRRPAEISLTDLNRLTHVLRMQTDVKLAVAIKFGISDEVNFAGW